jgi:ABC-type branched-subunit amino acid transport system substrate-binding protein
MPINYSGLIRPYGIILVCLMIAACAPRGMAPSAPPPVAATDKALQVQAETAYQKGELLTALDYYQVLIQNFPDSPLIPQAFLKIGRIQTALEDDLAALDSYQQLLATYPQSPEAMDARIEMLGALQRLGRNQEILDAAPAFADQVQGEIRRFRLYTILGDAHAALAVWDQAVTFYDLAMTDAPAIHRAALEEKTKTAVAMLQEDQIELLLGQVQDETVLGYLSFQQAASMAGASAYDDAVWLLTVFLERFPDHEYAAQARTLVEQLADKVAFDRYALGCLLPLSGPYQLFGARALDGIQLAFSDINAGQDGLPVRLVVKDTGSDPNQAARAMQALADAKVAAVIGPIATAESAAEVAQARRIPIMTISQREGLTAIGDNVFRNFITPRMQAAVLSSYMRETLGKRRFAVLYPDETYGRTFRDMFWEEIYRRGGEIVALEAYDPSATDFEDVIKKLVGRYYDTPEDLKALREPLDLLGPLTALPGYRPPVEEAAEENVPGRRSRSARQDDDAPPPIVDFEAILVPDSPKMLGLVVPQLVYHDVVNVTLLGTNLWFSEKLLKDAGEYVQGAVLPAGFYPASQSPRVQTFVAAFEAVYGRAPGFIEAVAYDSARIMLNAMLDPNVWLRAGIRHALMKAVPVEGVTGKVTFDGNGEPVKDLVLLRIEGSDFIEIDPSRAPVKGRSDDIPPAPLQ